jgi:hypothetical protein
MLFMGSGGAFKHKRAFSASRSAIYEINQEHPSRFLERKLGKELPSSDFFAFVTVENLFQQ